MPWGRVREILEEKVAIYESMDSVLFINVITCFWPMSCGRAKNHGESCQILTGQGVGGVAVFRVEMHTAHKM